MFSRLPSTATTPASRTLAAPALAVALLTPMLFACESDSADTSANGADAGGDTEIAATSSEALIRNVAGMVSDRTVDFAASAAVLATAAEAHAAAPTEASHAAAQDAWVEAMMLWQSLELAQFGPAARMTDSAGGEGLRDEIYSWPIDNPCRIDQVLVAQEFTAPDFADEPPNVRGLDALEYLLFAGAENACSEGSAINTSGDWDALSEGEIASRRAGFAAVVATLVRDEADALAAQWNTETGAFYAALTSAGNGSELFATRRDALNVISNALFYLDKETKDMKLALPTGLSGCAEATCPEALESFYAHVSGESVAANLVAFAALYHGSFDHAGTADDAIGFHELLIELGAEPLATELAAAIAAAVEMATADVAPLYERLESDPEGVLALYDAVKAITDLLKTQFVGVLDLELPQRAAGDND